MMTTPTADNFDRLAKALILRHEVTYPCARQMLGEFTLHLECGDDIRGSAALQAALLTAVNTGKRAFRGGVTVAMPEHVELLVPWPGTKTLNETALEQGAVAAADDVRKSTASLVFGGADAPAASLRVVCDGWRGGVMPSDMTHEFEPGADFALGGVYAGALGVARAFLSASRISNRDLVEPAGLSLWRPDVDWLSSGAMGPVLDALPAKLWLLGLGHLGQAYAWTLGLLPFATPSKTMLFLQDHDTVVEANWSAGLLCERDQVGRHKTRLCAEWLERRGFRTRIVERPFDESIRRLIDEPRIALCGFDNAGSRRLLEDPGFELVVEAGLGGTLDRFDRIVLHTFPDAASSARNTWPPSTNDSQPVDPALLGLSKAKCGMLVEEVTGKAISSSFTGACAGALVLAEILKAIHGGERREFLVYHLRDPELPGFVCQTENYQLRVARNGLVKASVTSSLRMMPNPYTETA